MKILTWVSKGLFAVKISQKSRIPKWAESEWRDRRRSFPASSMPEVVQKIHHGIPAIDDGVIAIYKSEILKAGKNTFRGFVFGQCISAKHSMNIIYIGLLRDRAPVIKHFQEFEFFFCHDKQAIECLGNCTEILQRTIDECESIDFLWKS